MTGCSLRSTLRILNILQITMNFRESMKRNCHIRAVREPETALLIPEMQQTKATEDKDDSNFTWTDCNASIQRTVFPSDLTRQNSTKKRASLSARNPSSFSCILQLYHLRLVPHSRDHLFYKISGPKPKARCIDARMARKIFRRKHIFVDQQLHALIPVIHQSPSHSPSPG